MRQLVHTQEIGLTESFATYITFIRLLPGVDTHVSDEGGLKGECFTTVLALFPFSLFCGSGSMKPLTVLTSVAPPAAFNRFLSALI